MENAIAGKKSILLDTVLGTEVHVVIYIVRAERDTRREMRREKKVARRAR